MFAPLHQWMLRNWTVPCLLVWASGLSWACGSDEPTSAGVGGSGTGATVSVGGATSAATTVAPTASTTRPMGAGAGTTGSTGGFVAATGSAGFGATSGNAGGASTGAGGSLGAASTSGNVVTTSAGGVAAMAAISTTGVTATEPVTLYLAGDSIVQTYEDTPSSGDQAGWGQMLGEYFDELVTVDNRAIGGRTARRFIDEGRLAEIDELLEPGDYLLVEFGTNDGNQSATYMLDGQTIPYYLDPATDFKDYLEQYIELARARDATPVLVTPPPRNSAYCTGGNGTGAHAEAMRELGAAEGVAVADLNAKSVSYLMAICPAPEPEDFFFLRGDGSVDGTHFQESGARILAGFVAEGIAEAELPLALYLD